MTGRRPVTYDVTVARWDPNPRQRLARAALDLFTERGYDATTVPDIAERAGLTKSTFFRHFDDKRGILFGGQDEMVAAFGAAVAAVPADTTLLGCVAAVLDAAAEYFPPESHAWVSARSAVIRAHPELRERELLKRADLGAAVEDALRSRGVGDVVARLAATVGMLALEIAYERWVAADQPATFATHAAAALDELAEQTAELTRAAGLCHDGETVRPTRC